MSAFVISSISVMTVFFSAAVLGYEQGDEVEPGRVNSSGTELPWEWLMAESGLEWIRKEAK